jgi:hypothetical protein
MILYREDFEHQKTPMRKRKMGKAVTKGRKNMGRN